MTAFLAQVVVALNALANAVGRPVLAFVAWVPGWLSATLVASASGAALLFIFKYTSNQAAIKRVRNDIDANLFALKLYKDATPVVLAAQVAMIRGAFRLFVLAVVPILVMMLPVSLLLGQISLWYQSRPLRVGEDAVVVLRLNGGGGDPMPDVRLGETSAARVITGPVRVPSQREFVWVVRANQEGSHNLRFLVGGQTFTKKLDIGEGFMRVSPRRPGWNWYDILLNPAEAAFQPSSPVQAVEVAYPDRPSWTSGTDTWVIYWFAVSMVAALCFKPFFNVNI
jgi:hypothetical protein